MIRVLVAEDSVTARELLVTVLRSDPKVEVIGEAKNGLEAVEMTTSLRPSVVTMDIRMPRMDGFEATRQIMIEAPTPIVIVTASVDVREVQVSMHALRAGALTLLPKPCGLAGPEFDREAKRFLETVKAMSAVKVVRRWPERRHVEAPPPSLPRASNGSGPHVVALAASTGGPAALARVLADIPGDFPLPLLAVQHIAIGFVEGLANWLNTAGALRVKVAEEGEPLLPRTFYLAPDHRHLGLHENQTVALSSAPAIAGFRPSASHLFAAVARVYGNASLAVILTGMGQDGIEGLRAIRSAGGRVLAQDEESSVVFGMPGAAIAEGLADAIVPLEAMATQIRELL